MNLYASHLLAKHFLLLTWLVVVTACSTGPNPGPAVPSNANTNILVTKTALPEMESPEPTLLVSPPLIATSNSISQPTKTAIATRTTLPTPLPTIPQVWVTPTTSKVHSLRLEKQVATKIVLDDEFIYWTPAPNSNRILRYPLAGGKIETIATSHFSNFNDGYLGSYDVLRSGDWLVFTDTRENDNSVWQIRALNLRTGLDKIILEDNDPASAPGPDYGVDGEWIVFARTSESKSENCVQTILSLQNLQTDEQHEIDGQCIEANYKWSNPKLVGRTLIVEQDLPEEKGGGNNIFRIDLETNNRTVLTNNGTSSMPQFNSKWLIWKGGRRYSLGHRIVIINLTNNEKRVLEAPVAEPSDPFLIEDSIYWYPNGFSLFFVYDLQKGQMLKNSLPDAKQAYDAVAVSPKWIAWSRDPDTDSVTAHDHFLEWRAFP